MQTKLRVRCRAAVDPEAGAGDLPRPKPLISTSGQKGGGRWSRQSNIGETLLLMLLLLEPQQLDPLLLEPQQLRLLLLG